jgi:hypothetical protein
MKVRIQADEIDASNVDELTRHPGWPVYRQRLVDMLTARCRQLRTTSTWEETIKAQAGADELEQVLKLPEILRKEILQPKQRRGDS